MLELKLEGVFDVAAARSVVRTVERTQGELDVCVDLTHVRELHDFAVAILAQGLAPRAEHVQLRGLSQHHLRVLGYLGLGKAPESRDLSDSAMA